MSREKKERMRMYTFLITPEERKRPDFQKFIDFIKQKDAVYWMGRQSDAMMIKVFAKDTETIEFPCGFLPQREYKITEGQKNQFIKQNYRF